MWQQFLKKQNWRKMKTGDIPAVEALLKSNERRCMNACSRYLNRKGLAAKTWVLQDGGGLCAVLVYSGRGFLPVLAMQDASPLPFPRFLKSIFRSVSVVSLQGTQDDVLCMETLMEKAGFAVTEKIDYDLMCIDKAPSVCASAFVKCPPGLVMRKPDFSDMESLVTLHRAYEEEEVLGCGREASPAASRHNMEKIFANEQVLVAQLGGRVVGKINTNAASFTRHQIGGVYVCPACRGLGIARKMAGEFVSGIIAGGTGVSLFVKKSNRAAVKVYRDIGFETIGNYRINYYRGSHG
jgi:ribosomal protein S18 acetylase RimI-like enzyme